MPKNVPQPNKFKKFLTFGWITTAVTLAVIIVIAAITISAANNARVTGTDFPMGSAGLGQPIVMGDANAPITMELFEDYQCPGCKGFELVYGDPKYDAIAAGSAKVSYYLVAFLTEGSALAANAAACAADQGKFSEYHQALFVHQPTEEQGVSFTNDLLLSLGESVKIEDKKTFERCVTTNRYAGWVDSMTGVMAEREITGTPSVFVDGTEFNFVDKSPRDLAVLLGLIEPQPEESAAPADDSEQS